MKNIDFVIKKVAEKNNFNEKLVAKVINHHWRRDIRDELLTHKHSAFYLRFIGTFTYGKRKVRDAIENLIQKIRRVAVSNKFTDETKAKIREKDYIILKRLLVQRNLTAKRYFDIENVIKNKKLLKAAASSIEQSDGDNTRMDQ